MTALSQAQIQSMLGRSAFIRFLDLEVVSLDAEREELVLRMPMRPELERYRDAARHGGKGDRGLISARARPSSVRRRSTVATAMMSTAARQPKPDCETSARSSSP